MSKCLMQIEMGKLLLKICKLRLFNTYVVIPLYLPLEAPLRNHIKDHSPRKILKASMQSTILPITHKLPTTNHFQIRISITPNTPRIPTRFQNPQNSSIATTTK
jgi:hypothetical protein